MNYCNIFYSSDGFYVHMSYTKVYAGMKFYFNLNPFESTFYEEIIVAETMFRNIRSSTILDALWIEWNIDYFRSDLNLNEQDYNSKKYIQIKPLKCYKSKIV